MLNTRREKFKRLLYAKKQAMISDSARGFKNIISGENMHILSKNIDDDSMPFLCQHENLTFRRLTYQRDIIKRIDNALERLDQGTYGRCEECDGEIGEDRLNLIPFAAYCTECQEAAEFKKTVRRILN
ncbi:MAG: TraR/DksA family transcriptional regulator [Nitrospirae bacterium]|nr:MAG: TraR/DksA family transcriptional regulator [Nitrospirota bacterium]